MKFEELYPNAKYTDEIQFEGSFLIKGDDRQKCWNCGEFTIWIDVLFEAYLCSEECERQKWREYFDAERKAGAIES